MVGREVGGSESEMKYTVLSYDPTNDSTSDFEWVVRARGVDAARAKKVVDGLLGRAYDRDMSICVDQVDPYSPDVELPSESIEKRPTLF